MEIDVDAIRAARRNSKLSQDDLAERIGCSRITISRAEQGKCGRKLAKKIADSLGVPVESFYGSDTADAGGLTEQQRQVVDIMKRFGPSTSYAIWSFAMGCAVNQTERQPQPR